MLAVREAVAEHIRIAREERRPTLVEAFTYRFRGHSAADPEVYRTKEEVEEWRKKDPIEGLRRPARLPRACISEDDLDEIAASARGAGDGGGRVRRRLARAAARVAVRQPLRARRRGDRRLVRGRRAHAGDRTAARRSARWAPRARSASWPRRVRPTPGQAERAPAGGRSRGDDQERGSEAAEECRRG